MTYTTLAKIDTRAINFFNTVPNLKTVDNGTTITFSGDNIREACRQWDNEYPHWSQQQADYSKEFAAERFGS